MNIDLTASVATLANATAPKGRPFDGIDMFITKFPHINSWSR